MVKRSLVGSFMVEKSITIRGQRIRILSFEVLYLLLLHDTI